jgi:ferric hydroxamate transport system substrate-binding protein
MNKNLTLLLAITTAALLAVTGCGTTEDDDPGAGDPTAADGPVTVTDGRGETVTLDAPASRVVALEWGEIEMLVSLGVMPVGVADPEGYGTWVTAAPLDSGVTDVGLRGEASVDAIVGLEPDLVVLEAEGGSALITQLEGYVPVIVTTGSDAAGDNLGRMRDDLTMIATAVGKVAEAEALLADFDTALAGGRQRIADAGAAGARFAMADGWSQGSSINIRMFGDGALVSDVATELGLANAWTGEVDEVWGLQTTDVEGLTTLADEDLTFVYNASGEEDVFADGLSGNAIWTSFEFVEQDRVHKLPEGIWTFGGPRSCQQFIDAMLQVYAA